ncbi:hypothetical protein TgHK011_001173 [Trichoderma gracile]|nr:hypothetical protein TgHK011_001173 [Trichoderma gracile]
MNRANLLWPPNLGLVWMPSRGHWLWRCGTTAAGPGTIDLAPGSQGWEVVPESPPALSSLLRIPIPQAVKSRAAVAAVRTEVRYSELEPRAACPKGPEPKRPAPAAGQGPGSVLLVFDRI